MALVLGDAKSAESAAAAAASSTQIAPLAQARSPSNHHCAAHSTHDACSSDMRPPATPISMSAGEEEEEEPDFKNRADEEEPKTQAARNADNDEAALVETSACAAQQSDVDASSGRSSASVLSSGSTNAENQTIGLRFLVRRREAGALIGKRGSNIKRLRETFRSSMFSIPDTGNGPERVVCIATDEKSMDPILNDLTQLLMEKSPENDEQVEIKLLIHSSHAGSIIGIGGQSIKKLRTESKAAIKIYEMCCPLSSERVCAIKAKPPVVVSTIKLIQSILNENAIKGTIKPYDALHFELNLVDKYGGFLPEEALDLMGAHHNHCEPMVGYNHHLDGYPPKHYSIWRSSDYQTSYDIQVGRQEGVTTCQMERHAAIGPMQAGQLEMGGGQLTKREIADCKDPQKAPLIPAYTPARHGRFHPYAPPPGHQVDFRACARSAASQQHHQPTAGLIGGYPRLQYNFTAQQQHARGTCLGSPNGPLNLPERCSHNSRPCLCMLLPIMPDALPSGPYVQLAKNYPRSFGYKKK